MFNTANNHYSIQQHLTEVYNNNNNNNNNNNTTI